MVEKCNNLPQNQCFLVKTTLKFQFFPKIITCKKSVRLVTSLGTSFPVPVENHTLAPTRCNYQGCAATLMTFALASQFHFYLPWGQHPFSIVS